MHGIPLSPTLHAQLGSTGPLLHGVFWHTEQNAHGGSVSTPLGRFYVTPAEPSDSFHPHLRLDCYFRVHVLLPEPLPAGQALARALLQQQLVTEPLWLEVHRDQWLTGQAYGDVFDYG